MVSEKSPTLPAQFLTAAEVAEWLKLSTTAVYSLCDAGELACHRIGLGKKRKRVRIPVAAVKAYIERTEDQPRAVIPMQENRGGSSGGDGGVKQRRGQAVGGCSRLRALGWKG